MRDDSDEKPCISFLAREVQPATKPTKARVEEEKGTRPFGPVSTAATEGWRIRPWPFTPRAEKAVSFGGPVAEKKSNLCYTFRLANDEEPVETALMASSSVAVTSEDSVNSNLATLMAPAEPLPGEVREPLSGGALTPSGGRSSTKTAQPSPAPVSATARRGATMRNNRIHRPNIITRRAAVELTGAVTRYRGVRPNKNNNNDENNINNNNHTALAERFQSSTLHKLRQLGIYANTGTPDDNNVINNNHMALAERFQPSTLHKLRQLGLYTNTDTPDDNNINNNNHMTLAERFQPGTLHKLRLLDFYTNTDTPDTAHQLDAAAVPAEVTYTRINTQSSCLGGGELDCVLQGGHDRFTPSYSVTLANAPIISKVGLQGPTAHSTMKVELVAPAPTMKEEAVFYSNMMLDLGFDKSFGSVPLYINSTSALHVAGNRTYSPRAKHIAMWYYLFVQELVEGKISIHYVVKSEDQLVDLGTKHLSKHRHRNVIKLINDKD